MQAFIVAAGLGTRLRPLTDNVPKCMIDIGGRPLLWYHIQLLKFHGIKDIWVNTHWLADQVQSYFGNGSKYGVHISYSHEKELLGTSGALKNPQSGIFNSLKTGPFLIIYGDDFTNFNYSKFIEFHNARKSFMTIAVDHSAEPWTKGVIETDSSEKIIRMVEKPPKDEIKSDLTNAGIYLCQPEVLDSIPDGFSDFAKDIIPIFLSQNQPLYAYIMDDYLQDTGTPQRYAKAREDFKTIKFPFSL
jgi:NDP-sugar pyrophosphorylase family protein